MAPNGAITIPGSTSVAPFPTLAAVEGSAPSDGERRTKATTARAGVARRIARPRPVRKEVPDRQGQYLPR